MLGNKKFDMMKRTIAILATSLFLTTAHAQTFLDHLQNDDKSSGQVSVKQSEDINKLVNGSGKNKEQDTKQEATRQESRSSSQDRPRQESRQRDTERDRVSTAEDEARDKARRERERKAREAARAKKAKTSETISKNSLLLYLMF